MGQLQGKMYTFLARKLMKKHSVLCLLVRKMKRKFIHWKEVIVVIMFKFTTPILSQKLLLVDNEFQVTKVSKTFPPHPCYQSSPRAVFEC